MSIARVMNMPDGSTPVPVTLAGGDLNGTLAPSILTHQAGTGCLPHQVARHLVHNTTTMGLVSPAVSQMVLPTATQSEVPNG